MEIEPGVMYFSASNKAYYFITKYAGPQHGHRYSMIRIKDDGYLVQPEEDYLHDLSLPDDLQQVGTHDITVWSDAGLDIIVKAIGEELENRKYKDTEFIEYATYVGKQLDRTLSYVYVGDGLFLEKLHGTISNSTLLKRNKLPMQLVLRGNTR